MDQVIKMSKEELKDRVRAFKLLERVCRKHANKYGTDDVEKVTIVQELAIAFLGNMTFRFLTKEALKSNYLDMISLVNQSLQQWFTEALNDTEFNKRIILNDKRYN